MYSLKLTGKKGGKYEFTLTDENDNSYRFKYYFDKNEKAVVLNYLDN